MGLNVNLLLLTKKILYERTARNKIYTGFQECMNQTTNISWFKDNIILKYSNIVNIVQTRHNLTLRFGEQLDLFYRRGTNGLNENLSRKKTTKIEI